MYSKNGYVQCKKWLKLALLGGEELPSAKNKRKFLTFTSFEHAILSPLPSLTILCTINLYSFELDRWTNYILLNPIKFASHIYHFRLTLSLEPSHSFFLKLKCITFSNVDYLGRNFVQFNSNFKAKTLIWV